MAYNETLDPQAFIETYGLDTEVAFANGMSMTLGEALELEKSFCTADASARKDPTKRIGYLAHKLAAADSLRPEHEHFLSLGESE
jgi:hypothetical protein